jgi:hypothetical protein
MQTGHGIDDLGAGLRTAVVKALGQAVSQGSHGGVLVGILDPFGDDGQSQRAGESGDGREQCRGRVLGGDGGGERSVEFEEVSGQGVQSAERGVSSAEVIDGDPDAAGTERVHGSNRGGCVDLEHGFGDFEHQLLGRPTGRDQGVFDPGDVVRFDQGQAGRIDVQGQPPRGNGGLHRRGVQTSPM